MPSAIHKPAIAIRRYDMAVLGQGNENSFSRLPSLPRKTGGEFLFYCVPKKIKPGIEELSVSRKSLAKDRTAFVSYFSITESCI